MNKVQVGQLLTIASGFDRFVTVDRVTTESWFLALEDVDYLQAQAVILEHYTGPEARKPLGVHHILEQVSAAGRTLPHQIEDDVRTAKARGIIPQDWPRRKPLDPEAAYRLSQARERARAELNRLAGGGEIEPSS